MRLALRVTSLKHRIARVRSASVPTGMASNPTAAPILFDRALLRARLDRARRGGPAKFLLDRVSRHHHETDSAVAARLLGRWETAVEEFVKLMPKDFKRVLEAEKKIAGDGAEPSPALAAAHDKS